MTNCRDSNIFKLLNQVKTGRYTTKERLYSKEYLNPDMGIKKEIFYYCQKRSH